MWASSVNEDGFKIFLFLKIISCAHTNWCVRPGITYMDRNFYYSYIQTGFRGSPRTADKNNNVCVCVCVSAITSPPIYFSLSNGSNYARTLIPNLMFKFQAIYFIGRSGFRFYLYL